jgi:signal transduction histidine kinase
MYLVELVSDAVRTMQSIATRRDVQLSLEIATPLSEEHDGAPLQGDPVLLDRLLLNLLDNAIKHAPPGTTVQLSLRLASMTRDDGPSSDQLEYVLRVSDAGSGIAPDAQPFIFDRFYRVDQARTRTAGATGTVDGAGLGLAIARWVAEVHGGHLDLESSSPSGTTFRWRMPVPLVASSGTRARSSGS